MSSQSEDNQLPVKFLEDEPVSVDKLKLHEDIAKDIRNIIANDGVKKKTIGLFGQWGSGKSSIIDIFSKNYQDEKNKIITYDSWAHRGDLLKRSFLLKLARELKAQNKNFDNNISIGDHLTKKIISKNYKITGDKPENWILFLSAIIIFAFLLRMLGVSFKKDILSNIPFSDKIEIIFIIIAITCFFALIVGLKNRGNGNEESDKTYDSIEKFINYYRGKKISFDEKHLAQEDLEFSSDFYQRCFKSIINSENKSSDEYENIIIVFDNLDRVDEDTVLDVLSMLQLSLQNDANGQKKPWFIVPIDKERLSQILSKQFQNIGNNNVVRPDNNISNNKNGLREANDFIEKIFQFRIEIPPINESNWRSLYEEKFYEIFKSYDKKEDNDKQIFTRRIFESFVSSESTQNFLTPREVISFLNDLGVNYLFWHGKEGDISIKLQSLYLALKKYCLINDFKDEEYLINIINERANFVYNDFDESEVYEAILKQHYKSDNIIDLFVNKAKKLLQDNDHDSLNKIIKNLDPNKKNRLMERVLEVSEDELTDDINLISNFIETIEDSDLKKEGKKYYKEIIAKIDYHINNGTIEDLKPEHTEGICIFLSQNEKLKNHFVDKSVDILFTPKEQEEVSEEN